MKKTRMLGIVLLMALLPLNAAHAEAAQTREINYERDYLSWMYDSDDGLEGTAVKSICSDENGFIWMGSYTGLYRYDGTQMEKYSISDRSVTVNDICRRSGRNSLDWNKQRRNLQL